VYLAYVTSFATILIMWVNHHQLLKCVQRVDHLLLMLNGLLLLFVTVLPFPTSLVAVYLRHPGGRTAGVVYAGVMIAIAIAFNGLWQYILRQPGIRDPHLSRAYLSRITRQYNLGGSAYLIALLLAFFSVVGCLLVNLGLAILFSLPSPIRYED
jgi:uncharacterized membrane protein